MPQKGREYLDGRTKRSFDVLGSLALGIGLSPAAVAIGLESMIEHRQWNPIYKQKRVGKEGHAITIPKFETLHKEDGADIVALFGGWDHPLASPVGRLLRRSGLDEIPQLSSVLRGDLSLVGTRPITQDYHDYYATNLDPDLYAEWQRGPAQHPGLVGVGQLYTKQFPIHTIGHVAQQMCLENWYHQNASLALDLKILARTPFQLLGLAAPPEPKLLLEAA